jgi:RNA polymerase sigma-70 factor (ECF subfamily)
MFQRLTFTGFSYSLLKARGYCYGFAADVSARLQRKRMAAAWTSRQSATASPPYLREEEITVLSSAELKGGSADVSLVSAIRSGDENAMALLYDRYSSIVYSVALRVLGDTGAAEDVLQEVFMQLWRNPGVFDSSRGSLGAWLAVIARNRAIDAVRKRHPQTDIADVIVSVEPDLAGDAERARVMEKVLDALGAMPLTQRSALEMAYFEGLTHTEIAAKTGEPLGTIKTRIRTGLLALRKAFST